MTPNEMRAKKVQDITEAAQSLGWEALVEIEGFSFTALLSAEGATGQMIEGKLSKALDLIDEFGGPELYPTTEEYDLVPLGVHDEAAELDEFVQDDAHPCDQCASCSPECPDAGREGYGYTGPRNQRDTVPPAEIEDLRAMNEEHDAGEKEEEDMTNDEEDAADAMCEKCGECGIHEDSEFGDGRYTSPKEVWAAAQTSDTPQNEFEHENGGPKLAQEAKMSEKTEGYVKTASRIVAEDGFVIVVRPTAEDQKKGFKVQRFASINRSHAETLRDKFGYGINIAAQ